MFDVGGILRQRGVLWVVIVTGRVVGGGGRAKLGVGGDSGTRGLVIGGLDWHGNGSVSLTSEW